MKTLLILVGVAAGALGALVLLAWWGQERVVFQPPGVTVPQVDGAERMEFDGADGTPLVAYLVRNEPRRDSADAPPLVIHFHGNAEIAAWRIPWAREVARRTGAAVLLAEYRGYGGLTGTPSYEASRRDALALWQVAQAELGAVPGTTIVHGFSLGSAVATELAGAIGPHALVLEAPFTSAHDMATRMGFLLRGPLWRLIARVHYDTERAVAGLDAPVWVAHGDADDVIPATMGRAVFEAARQKGEFLAVAGAGHGELADAPRYWEWLDGSTRIR